MNSEKDNYEDIYCADDDEFRVYCDICDKLCVERYYKNHLNSNTHINNNQRKRKSFQINLVN